MHWLDCMENYMNPDNLIFLHFLLSSPFVWELARPGKPREYGIVKSLCIAEVNIREFPLFNGPLLLLIIIIGYYHYFLQKEYVF